MNEESKNNYYAIIPATVRYNKDLKPNEKLLYGEITALANSKGFCFASNRYFAELYKVTIHTVSQWISHLEKLGYVNIELIKDNKKEIKERRIYISDTPYIQKDTYPYVLKSTYPIYKKVQDNNINIKIDDLFLFIINNSDKISNEFYLIINKLEFNYTTDILSIMQENKIQMIKEIIYTLYSLYNTDFKYILPKINRDELINIYIISKEHNPSDFLNYYKMAIINKYAKNTT